MALSKNLTRRLAAIGIVVLASAISGCGAGTQEVTGGQAVALQNASLERAADHRLVAIGEATHGNAEFVQIRQMITERLVGHGFRTVALEADYGGTAEANEYLQGDGGSAEDAARALGFNLYRTEETAELLRWIHDHNADAPAVERVQLIGFDMQRFDANKRRLLAYLSEVDTEQALAVEQQLSALTDAGRSDLGGQRLVAATRAADAVVADMIDNRERYRSRSSGHAYERAVHHAATIQQGAELLGAGPSYASKRDAWMAANIDWIIEHELTSPGAKMIIAGHNGHVEKTGAAFSFDSLGERLAAAHGKDYFVIGTEFGRSTFVARDGAGGARRSFTVDNDTPLADLYDASGPRELDLGYLDIESASAADPATAELLRGTVRMGSIGDEFGWWRPLVRQAYTVAMVPADAYDALVYVPEAHPVTDLR